MNVKLEQNVKGRWMFYLNNLYKKNKKNYFKILKRRVSFEISKKRNPEGLIKAATQKYLYSCDAPFIECLNNVAQHTPSDLYFLEAAIATVEENSTCGAQILAARQVFLKNQTAGKITSKTVNNLFKAGYYKKIVASLIPEEISDDETALLYALALAQTGEISRLEKFISKYSKSNTQTSDLNVQLNFRKAIALRKKGKYKEAISQLSSIASKIEGSTLIGWVHLEKSINAFQLGLKKESFTYLDNSTQLLSKNDGLLPVYHKIWASFIGSKNTRVPDEKKFLETIQAFDFFDVYKFCTDFLVDTNRFPRVIAACKVSTHIKD